MNIWRLRAAAVMWLRYERHCPIVAMERGLGSGVPDVLGVSDTRHLIEIEIKVTMADFRKNEKKWGIRHRRLYDQPAYWIPRQFYFLVATKIVEKVRVELPQGCGLLSLPFDNEPSIFMERYPEAGRAGAGADRPARDKTEPKVLYCHGETSNWNVVVGAQRAQ